MVGYVHTAGKQQTAQQHLWQIPRAGVAEFPLGLRCRVSGSGQSLPLVPWVALLDPDVTTTATDGLYVVYLFDRTVQRVYLSMNQGATQHRRHAEAQGLRGRAAERAALAEIVSETTLLRAQLDPSVIAGTQRDIDLGAPAFLPAAYEAGSIAAVAYPTASWPGRDELADHLAHFADLYRVCVALTTELAADQQIRTRARAASGRSMANPQPVFKPKDSSEYTANVGVAAQRRTRSHEALIEAFGTVAIAGDRTVATNVHPRDLTIDDGSAHWLVEAKTVGPNAEPAVRDAIGQLVAYRHFYYRERGLPDPQMLALFNAPIGDAFEALLRSLEIDYVCRDRGGWSGSAAGLALLS